nr:hypothetical protein [Cystobacter sp.]
MSNTIKPFQSHAFSIPVFRPDSLSVNTGRNSAGGDTHASVNPLATHWMRDSFVAAGDPRSGGAQLGGCFPMADKASQPDGTETASELLKDCLEELMSCLELLMSGMDDKMAQGMEGAPSEVEGMAPEGDATGSPSPMDGAAESQASAAGSGAQSEKSKKAAKRTEGASKARTQPARDGDAGKIKSSDVMKRAKTEGAEINRTGGYRFDGKNDCYGFVRRVWDPILEAQGKSKLPVNDVGSKNWSRIDWDKLKPGAVLSTHQGHAWGDKWHGGLYAGKINGKHYIYDNSGSQSAKLRPLPSPDYFKYVHTPTLKMLDGKA